jgi:hypothetical protein
MTMREWLFGDIYQIDELGNAIGGDFLFSEFGGKASETISSTMGKVLAKDLWLHRSEPGYDPSYPWKYPFGKFSNWLCSLIQPYHSLRSIEWNSGINIEKMYPGIKAMVEEYLKVKGVTT